MRRKTGEGERKKRVSLRVGKLLLTGKIACGGRADGRNEKIGVKFWCKGVLNP